MKYLKSYSIYEALLSNDEIHAKFYPTVPKDAYDNWDSTRLIVAFKKIVTKQFSLFDIELEAPAKNTCLIDCIWNNGNARVGTGTTVMRLLMQMADEYSVDLTLQVHPLHYDAESEYYDEDEKKEFFIKNQQYMEFPDLFSWYHRLGFVLQDGADKDDPRMIRKHL